MDFDMGKLLRHGAESCLDSVYVIDSFQPEFNDAGKDPGELFRIAPARLVEDELADLDRLNVFRRPAGHYVPVMEIQCAAGSIR